MSIISIITMITTVISIIGFRNEDIFSKWMLNPYKVIHNKEYQRIITHGFLHADWAHLIINMIVFISFGEALLAYFQYYFSFNSKLLFITFYLLALALSSTYSIHKHKDNSGYNAIGASGAVSAVVFASIFFDPLRQLLFFGVFPIPGILFAVLYLYYSYYMSKKSYDNIGHDAHFWGAIFGIVFPIVLQPSLISLFFNKLTEF